MNGSTGIVPTMPIGGDGFGFGGDGIWALLIFAMIFNGGFGNNNNRYATQDYVASEFTQQAINNGFENVNSNIFNGFGRTNDNLCNLKEQVLENRYAGQLAACQTQRDVLQQTNELNTNLLVSALNSQSKMDECCCQIRQENAAGIQKVLDVLNQNTIDSLRSEVNDLKNSITANGIGSTIINSVRPYPVPAYAVSSPYVGLNGFYGSNWYGNTII